MIIRTLTYNKNRTQEVIHEQFQQALHDCYVETKSAQAAWKLTHMLAYKALLLLPAGKLQHGTVYSFGEICHEQVGLVHRFGLRDYLERVGDMQVFNAEILHTILTDALLPEVLRHLKVNVTEVYLALCAAYFLEIGDVQKYNILQGISESSTQKYQDCYNLLTQ